MSSLFVQSETFFLIVFSVLSLLATRYAFSRTSWDHASLLGLRRLVVDSSDTEEQFVDSHFPSGSKRLDGFNVIAVHGLGANPKFTWTARCADSCIAGEKAPLRRVCWLTAFLPRRFQNIRVWTFNHNANWLYDAPTVGFEQPARDLVDSIDTLCRKTDSGSTQCPLILIGHSYGGIIIKQAIVLAANEGRWLSTAACGIIFLGTPHKGSDISGRITWLVNLGAWLIGSKTILLKALQWHGDDLRQLDNSFLKVVNAKPHIKLHCFFETKDSTFGPLGLVRAGRIVDQTSATLPPPHAESGMNTHHAGLNKFATIEDQGFAKICESIEDMVYHAKGMLVSVLTGIDRSMRADKGSSRNSSRQLSKLTTKRQFESAANWTIREESFKTDM
ncbi:hypothetical protein K461DRAFT_296243 [Myriangium duriaei CBS 260.36]|uniref:GPI inositol-deacylase n=1 Tax=Myriangium duriaei CBS 260.36 TaxID=1168546 RepID=A0A9P4IZV6_9PEZI|nr:hypothetical protein K461DRAFT_296243 [Myriangium duriaei CBS 260.36]